MLGLLERRSGYGQTGLFPLQEVPHKGKPGSLPHLCQSSLQRARADPHHSPKRTNAHNAHNAHNGPASSKAS